jgi:hypothetical protein
MIIEDNKMPEDIQRSTDYIGVPVWPKHEVKTKVIASQRKGDIIKYTIKTQLDGVIYEEELTIDTEFIHKCPIASLREKVKEKIKQKQSEEIAITCHLSKWSTIQQM